MSQTQSLFPATVKVISISVTDTSSTAVALPGIGNTLWVSTDSGGSKCFLSVGGSDVGAATVPSGTAATTCLPCQAGMEKVHSVPNVQQYVRAICASGETATLWLAVNEGC